MPGKMSDNKNLNFLISVKVSFDNVLILIALIKSSHSVSKETSSVFAEDLCSKINLPATDRIVLRALRPQS